MIGMTADVGPTVSLGVLGAVGETRRTWRGGTLDRFLRLDVNLYPSQSGAAVVTSEGELVGLATPALLRYSSVAVPLVTLRRITAELLKEGRIKRGYLGIGVQAVAVPESLRKQAGIEQAGGLMVLSVEPGSPAEQAGLQLGDLLLSIGGKATAEADELQDALRGEAVGKRLKARIARGGASLPELEIAIAERPNARTTGKGE